MDESHAGTSFSLPITQDYSMVSLVIGPNVLSKLFQAVGLQDVEVLESRSSLPTNHSSFVTWPKMHC